MIVSKNKGILFIIFYVILYYIWQIIWKENKMLINIGSDIFSLFGSVTATILLYCAAKKSKQIERILWLLLSLGCFSYFLAEIIWAYYDFVLKKEVPFPSYSDLFYMLQYIFYLIAFIYPLSKGKKSPFVIRIITDILIIMTVAFSFSYTYLIKPILAVHDVSGMFLFVSIGYPVGDLGLLVVALFYLSNSVVVSKKSAKYIFYGLFIQIIADSSYLYLISIDKYHEAELIDPLLILSLLLIGLSGYYSATDLRKLEYNSHRELGKFKIARFILPYACLAGLLIFAVVRNTTVDAITVGSSISIFLIIIRFLLIRIENNVLMKRLLQQAEELSKNQEIATHLAYHDPLTDLPNRRFFEENLHSAIQEAQSTQTMLAVMFIDLDRFKIINDTLGHDFGDQLLFSVAERFKKHLNNNHFVARQGGDEFTVLIKHLNDNEKVATISKKILDTINQPFNINGKVLHISPSIGISIYPKDGEDALTLMKNADIALYRVKENGKNNFSFYTNDKIKRESKQGLIENEFLTSLKDHQFYLQYQPQYDLNSGKMLGVEALLRWNHPIKGTLLPDEFLTEAEETGYFNKISDWVLIHSCQQIREWHQRGRMIKLSINLSPLEFFQGNLVKRISHAIEISSIDPSYIVLEINEDITLKDTELIIDTFIQIKKLGISIAIDNLGLGFTSLPNLAKLPIDTIKISRHIIHHIGVNKAYEAMIKSMIMYANDLNINLIAVGVESKNQLDFLTIESNRIIVQGFLFNEPFETLESIEEILQMNTVN